MADTSTSLAGNRDITCDALELALVATQLRSAWHAGVLSADMAMRILDVAVREVCNLRAMEIQPEGVCSRAMNCSAPSDSRRARLQLTPFDRRRR